ncbi:MAG: hypothetical protein WCJ88_05195 [Actinomycetes bacterium]
MSSRISSKRRAADLSIVAVTIVAVVTAWAFIPKDAPSSQSVEAPTGQALGSEQAVSPVTVSESLGTTATTTPAPTTQTLDNTSTPTTNPTPNRSTNATPNSTPNTTAPARSPSKRTQAVSPPATTPPSITPPTTVRPRPRRNQ